MKTDGLTELEVLVLKAARRTDYGDCLEYPQWSFAVCDASGLNEKVYRGVVSSLVKKGIVMISDDEGKGLYMDMTFEFTEKGTLLFNEG